MADVTPIVGSTPPPAPAAAAPFDAAADLQPTGPVDPAASARAATASTQPVPLGDRDETHRESAPVKASETIDPSEAASSEARAGESRPVAARARSAAWAEVLPPRIERAGTVAIVDEAHTVVARKAVPELGDPTRGSDTHVDAEAMPVSPAVATIAPDGVAPRPAGEAVVAQGGIDPTRDLEAADRLLDRIVGALRSSPASGAAPALESRIHDPDLGPIRLRVSGVPGQPVTAEVVVADVRAARALSEAADRADATTRGLHGIDLRIRLEPPPTPDRSTAFDFARHGRDDGPAFGGREHAAGHGGEGSRPRESESPRATVAHLRRVAASTEPRPKHRTPVRGDGATLDIHA